MLSIKFQSGIEITNESLEKAEKVLVVYVVIFAIAVHSARYSILWSREDSI